MKGSEQMKDQKIGKVFLLFAGLCVLALPLVVLAAFNYDAGEESTPMVAGAPISNFDHKGNAIFENYDRIVKEYLEGVSTERTLEEYYSRRQYLGSPPFIPHKIEDSEGAEMTCLTCHNQGGWTAELKRHTPVTPHPEYRACQQCHVPEADQPLFAPNDWVSVRPPRLGHKKTFTCQLFGPVAQHRFDDR